MNRLVVQIVIVRLVEEHVLLQRALHDVRHLRVESNLGWNAQLSRPNWVQLARESLQEGRLPRANLADHRNFLTLGHVDIDVMENWILPPQPTERALQPQLRGLHARRELCWPGRGPMRHALLLLCSRNVGFLYLQALLYSLKDRCNDCKLWNLSTPNGGGALEGVQDLNDDKDFTRSHLSIKDHVAEQRGYDNSLRQCKNSCNSAAQPPPE
mmetsp:Transcript_90216/g.156341  ORF Transcript_90216/g.156341 Transcript_90216/m.156341 type:complete len:212 (-) Transcript_90216:60-695(-)